MRDTELYRHLLGLGAPWGVGRVELSVAEGRVDVWVEHPGRTRFACPDCDVSLANVDGTITLTVDDDGEGVADDDRQRIFERFTRTDSSRSRDTGGVGLGLAVVRATAQRHGGDVQCEASPLGGARLIVTLPGDTNH